MKIFFTTRNVRLDSGHYATKYYFFMNDGCASSFIHQIIRMNGAAFNFLCNHRLVHVVWDFRPWNIMTKVCTLFFYASFSIFEPLRRPQGQNSGRSRSLASLQIMFNFQNSQIMILNTPDFCPWEVMTKVRYFLMVQIHNLRILEV